MEENKDNPTRLKTVSYDKINTNRRRSNLRQLQLNILDSLTKGPIINIKKNMKKVFIKIFLKLLDIKKKLIRKMIKNFFY